MRRLLLSLIIFTALPAQHVAAGSATTCATSASTADVTAYLASDKVPLHGDYQRSLLLADGRVLWTFQDAYVRDARGRSALIHNAAMVQTGRCFDLLRGGTARAPAAWLLPQSTTPFRHWFWPLASTIAADGTIRIFAAEMRELGDHYLSNVEPIATWMVTVRQTDLAIVDARLAPDSTPSLFGWSITSDSQWTYLYGYCYRQFGFDPLLFSTTRAHDLGCSADVQVARVHRGALDDQPTYWNGGRWTTDASSAAAVMPRAGRDINPAQVQWTGRQFVAVTKAGDWFGDTIYVDIARSAHGPWTTVSSLKIAPLCDDCNTYFASIVAAPSDHSTLTIGISNNRWDGRESAWYRPTLLSIPSPRTPARDGPGRLT
jgi:hypothetical protein